MIKFNWFKLGEGDRKTRKMLVQKEEISIYAWILGCIRIDKMPVMYMFSPEILTLSWSYSLVLPFPLKMLGYIKKESIMGHVVQKPLCASLQYSSESQCCRCTSLLLLSVTWRLPCQQHGTSLFSLSGALCEFSLGLAEYECPLSDWL